MSAIDEMYKKYGFGKRPYITDGIYPKIYLSYPPFTAEKQIALIKQMVKDNVIGFFKITQGLSKDYILFYEGCKSQHEDFAQALAKLTTELYDSLPEAYQQEIKEILER